jgi:hypothetical protein
MAVVSFGTGSLPDPITCDAILARSTNSIQIGTNDYRLETWLWRDMMPGIPPSGLLATVSLVETKGAAIPASLSMTRIRFINGTAIWTVVAPPRNFMLPPYMLETTLRNGPDWPGGTPVDVVLELANGSVRYLLIARSQLISVAW